MAEIKRADLVNSEAIPRNVVTMGSFVSVINLETLERMGFHLVYPDEADLKANKISILSPIGAGVLGYRVGDE
ncbi:UNVERIFIED_CONTAM: hypothetical protein GTU68_055006, partial [Idotea baltica]|nr:hypothetical protein [Idotea baltica]